MNQSPGFPAAKGAPDSVLPNVYVSPDETGYQPPLEEALVAPDALFVLSGDYGGTIFLTVPVRIARCDIETLRVLVSDLDAVTWMSGDPTIAELIVDRLAVGSRVPGGDGGGLVVEGVWTHPTMLPDRIRTQAVAVVCGERTRIDGGLLREARTEKLAQKRAFRESLMARRTLPWDIDIFPPLVPFDNV